MKAILPLVACGLISVIAAEPEPNSSLPAHPAPLPCDKEGKILPKFVTRENFTFSNSTLLAKYPDGLLFKVGTVAPPVTRPHAGMQDCVVMVPQECLPEAIRKAVGGFNATAAEEARKQREQAFAAGNNEGFAKNVTGNWKVEWHLPQSEDPFKDKPGKAQSWEEYQATLAKLKEEEAQEQARTAEVIEAAKKAIADPAGTEWFWASGGKLELRGDGSARHTSWKKPGRWTKTPEGKLSVTTDTKSFMITFDDEGVGQVVGGDGKTTQIHLRSKKNSDAKPERAPSRLE